MNFPLLRGLVSEKEPQEHFGQRRSAKSRVLGLPAPLGTGQATGKTIGQ
jgi:hypothetical protein